MKKYLCILAGVALLAACEQKTETVAPAASPTPTPETSETPATAAEPMNTLPPQPEGSESVNMTPFDPNGPSSFASPTPTP